MNAVTHRFGVTASQLVARAFNVTPGDIARKEDQS
jgi:hypothetical protein